MRLHFATIPIFDSGAAAGELNRFLATHRVLSVDRQLVADGSRSAWAVCVTYVEGEERQVPVARRRIDYREVLPPNEFAVYARLRELRKKLAKAEGVPVFAILSNEQLATIVRRRLRTARELGEIDGVGKSRVDKYGAAFLEMMCAALDAGELSLPDQEKDDETKPGRP